MRYDPRVGEREMRDKSPKILKLAAPRGCAESAEMISRRVQRHHSWNARGRGRPLHKTHTNEKGRQLAALCFAES